MQTLVRFLVRLGSVSGADTALFVGLEILKIDRPENPKSLTMKTATWQGSISANPGFNRCVWLSLNVSSSFAEKAWKDPAVKS